jgi:PleD family two-component response regulator
LTCSFGVAQWFAGMDEDTIIGNADTALYCAKNSDKNTVCVYRDGKTAVHESP